MNWPNLFEPRPKDPDNPSSDKEYSVEAIFPKEADFTEMKQAALDALVKLFGADQTKWPAGIKSPFRNQGEKSKNGTLPPGYAEGNIFMKFKTSAKTRPGVVDAQVKAIIDPAKVYAGAWAYADVNASAYGDKPAHKGNKGVSFYLNHIQVVKDDEPLDNRVRVEGAFKAIAGAVATGAPAGAPAASTFG